MSPLIIAAVAAGAYLVFFRKPSAGSGPGATVPPPGVKPVAYNVPTDTFLSITEVQQALNMLGFGPLAEDGVYGPNTAAAIRAFQTQAGIAVDRIAGPQTAAAIHTAMADIGLSLGGDQATSGPRFDPRQTPWYAYHHGH